MKTRGAKRAKFKVGQVVECVGAMDTICGRASGTKGEAGMSKTVQERQQEAELKAVDLLAEHDRLKAQRDELLVALRAWIEWDDESEHVYSTHNSRVGRLMKQARAAIAEANKP